MLAPWKKSYDQPRQSIEKKRHYFASNGLSSHVWMRQLGHKEWWVIKNWRFWTVVLGKTLENPLNYKEIQQVHSKGNQSWIFIGRTHAEAEIPILWPTDVNNLFRKAPITGKDWRQEEKRMTEDETVGWHHWLDDMSLSTIQELVKDWEAWHAAVHGIAKSWTWLNDWTELHIRHCKC